MIIECYSSFTCKTTHLICNYSFLKIKTLHTCLHVYIHIYSQILTRKQGRNLSGNWEGGECLFIYSCYARRIFFEINSNSKEIRRAEHEYMNKHPPPPNLRSSDVPARKPGNFIVLISRKREDGQRIIWQKL